MNLIVSGTALYTMILSAYALLLIPEECVISVENLSPNSSFEPSKMKARRYCTDRGLVLQYFEYPVDVRGNASDEEMVSKYTCCKTKRETLSCKTILVDQMNNDCLETHEQLVKLALGCQKYSVSQTPNIWHLRDNVCPAGKVSVQAYLCCELSIIPECVHNNESCVISIYRSDNCYNMSTMTRVAYDDCHGTMRELHNVELEERCRAYGTLNGYKKITYACCPSTMNGKRTDPSIPGYNDCEFIHVRDYCKDTRNISQPACSNDRSDVMIVMNEQRCDCPGGPDKELVKYACCVTNDVCSRIQSDAFPNQYYWEETLHTGTDIPKTIDCYQGSLMRVCAKRGLRATWTSEVNDDCKTREMAKKNICEGIPSDAFPNDYYFKEELYLGYQRIHGIPCHKGYLQRICMMVGSQATWDKEFNMGCKTRKMVEKNTCKAIPSDAFPNDYRFVDALYEGYDMVHGTACHEGYLERICSKTSNQATWGPEVIKGCKTREMVEKDICSGIASRVFPNKYYFEETRYRGADITYVIECHEGTLNKVCTKKGIQAGWGIETNNGCKTLDMVMNEANMDSQIGKQMSSEKVKEIVDQIDGVIAEAVKNKTIAKKMLSVVGNLMNVENAILVQAERKVGHNKVVSIVENFTSQLHISNSDSNVIATKNITVGAYKIDRINEPLVVKSDFERIDSLGQTIKIDGPLVTIYPDILATLREENDRIQIISYSSPKLFYNSKSMESSNNYSVITMFVNNDMSFKTNQTVVTYKIPRHKEDNKTFTCVFWDTITGKWSADGMDLFSEENGDKVCRSTHLSSFYILMDTDASHRFSAYDERYLTYISYIGCGVSVIGLIGTILTYALFKSLHGDVSGKILLNICVSMLLLNLIFLLGSLDSETYDVGICMAVGISLHYFLLTTLIWMMIEALNMYQMLIVVFSDRPRWFMRIRLLAGWGIPLGVVGITMGVSIDNYKPNNQFCFMSHTNQAAFYVAVLAPTCLILLINTYVFIRVSIIVLRSSRYATDASKATSSISITQVRGAMSVMIVLGITWILGPLAIGPAKVVFAYMFTILNSIQGFLVFLFRCLLNKEARLSWRYLFTIGRRKRKRGSHPTTSTGTWTKSSEIKSKTIRYPNVSASVSKSGLSSRTRGKFSDNPGESGKNTTDGIDIEGYTEFKPDKNVEHMNYQRETDASSKSVRLNYNEINSEDTQSNQKNLGNIHDSKLQHIVDSKIVNAHINGIDTHTVQNYDQRRALKAAESNATVPSWLSTSKTSMQSEMAKMKSNRYGLSTSGTSRAIVPKYSLSRSKTSLLKQSAYTARMKLGRGKPAISNTEVSRHPNCFSPSKTSLRSEVGKMKRRRYDNAIYETSHTSVSSKYNGPTWEHIMESSLSYNTK